MKPYKRISAVDSDRLIVIDDNVREVSIVKVFLHLAGYVCLFGLTCYGMIGGVTSKPVMDKLKDLDRWVDQPASKELMFYYCVGLIVVVCLWTVGYVFFVRKK